MVLGWHRSHTLVENCFPTEYQTSAVSHLYEFKTECSRLPDYDTGANHYSLYLVLLVNFVRLTRYICIIYLRGEAIC